MAADAKVRIGILGCGQIAHSHLKNYAAITEAEVVACADIDKTAADTTARTFNIPNVYDNGPEMLARDDLDAVDVCLHNNLHVSGTVAALEANKHVYCEKPMAGAYADAQTMLARARETGKMLHIQLAGLYSDETRAARDLIDAGELGALYHARATGHRRRGRPFVDGYGKPAFVQKAVSGGGALFDMGVYHISEILFLLNNPAPARISGVTYQKTDMDAARRQLSSYGVEELGMGFVRFEDTDLTLSLIEAWAIHLDAFEGSYVVGDKGGVRLKPFGFFRSLGDLDVDGAAGLERARFRWNNVRAGGQPDWRGSSQRHWVGALRGETDLLPTAEIALTTSLISEGIYLSQSLNREVTADEVKETSLSKALPL